jgi:hypothetical protein
MSISTEKYHRFYLSVTSRGVSIEHARLNVVKRTPCGAWVNEYYDTPTKWVSDHTRIAYAYADEDKAWASFKIRMRHRKRHAERAFTAVSRTVEMMPEDPPRDSFMVFKEEELDLC